MRAHRVSRYRSTYCSVMFKLQRAGGAPARARRDPSESNSAAAESSLLIIMNNPAREVARARLRRRPAAGIHAFIKNRIIYYKMICLAAHG